MLLLFVWSVWSVALGNFFPPYSVLIYSVLWIRTIWTDLACHISLPTSQKAPHTFVCPCVENLRNFLYRYLSLIGMIELSCRRRTISPYFFIHITVFCFAAELLKGNREKFCFFLLFIWNCQEIVSKLQSRDPFWIGRTNWRLIKENP